MMDTIIIQDICLKLTFGAGGAESVENATFMANLVLDRMILDETEIGGKEPDAMLWKLPGTFLVPANSASFTIVLVKFRPDEEMRLTGSIQISTEPILAQAAKDKKTVFRLHIQTSGEEDEPLGELAFSALMSTSNYSGRVTPARVIQLVRSLDAIGIVSLLTEICTSDSSCLSPDIAMLNALYGVVSSLPDDPKLKPDGLGLLANIHIMRYDTYLKVSDDDYRRLSMYDIHAHELNRAIGMLEDALRMAAIDHPKGRWLQLSACMAMQRSIAQQERDTKTYRILVHKMLKVVFNLPDNEPTKPILSNFVGVALYQTFGETGDRSELDNSITMLDTAVRLTLNTPSSKASYFEDLGISLTRRFELLDDPRDISRSLQARHDFLNLTTDRKSDKPVQLNLLGHAFFARAAEYDDLELTQKSISAYESALALISGDHPERSSILNNLAASLQLRFKQSGPSANLKDLTRIQTALAKAVKVSPQNDANKISYIVNYAKCLLFNFEKLEDVKFLDQCVSSFRDAHCMAATATTEKIFLLHGLGLSLLDLRDDLVKLSLLSEVMSLCEALVHIIPDDSPRKSRALMDLATSFSRFFAKQGGLDDFTRVVSILERASSLVSDNDAAKSTVLNQLGEAYINCFKCSDDPSNLEKAFTSLKKALELTESGEHPGKPSILNNLGHSHFHQFRRIHDIGDIHQSLAMYERALAITPKDNLDRALWLSDAALARLLLFEETMEPVDLDVSIVNFQESIRQPARWPSAVRKQVVLHDLACALFYRFHKRLDYKDLDSAVELIEDAAYLISQNSPARDEPRYDSTDYFVQYFQRFSGTGDVDDIVIASKKLVQIFPMAETHDYIRFQNIGLFLSIRLHLLSSRGEMKPSILATLEEVVKLLPQSYRRTTLWYSMVGDLIFQHFKRFGSINDLMRSVALFEDAYRRPHDGHPPSLKIANHLGLSLLTRFRWLGNLNDLNRAVNILEDAADLCQDEDPDRQKLFNNLGVALVERYNHHHDYEDLNKSLSVFQNAQHSKISPYVGSTVEENLTMIVRKRIDIQGDIDEINTALEDLEERLSRVELNPLQDKSNFNDYGIMLLRRYRILNDIDDVHKAIQTFEQLLTYTNVENDIRINALQNLSYAVVQRFIEGNDAEDISKCITLLKQAIDLIPDSHPVPASLLFDLGRWLPARFERLHDVLDLDEAFSHLSKLANSQTAQTLIRFRAASFWAYCARHFEHGDPLPAYALSLKLLPQLAWLGLAMPVRHLQLLGAGEVVTDAVAIAVEHRQYKTAIEWFEQGRSIIWSQLAQLRISTKELALDHPDIAKRLQILSEKLESNAEYNPDPSFFSIKGTRFHDLAHERSQLIEEIRSLDGFTDFLLPKTLDHLASCALGGPVVCINISNFRCDALAIVPTSNEVIHIPLEQFTAVDANALLQSLKDVLQYQGALRGRKETDRSLLRGRRRINPDIVFENILSKLWLCVAKPILDGLDIKTPSTGTWPRIWWCLTGPLALLPIHAAGLYGASQSLGNKLSDFVISSYTPSLSALISSALPRSKTENQILAVALPVQSNLPCTENEIDKIKLSTTSNILELMESDATVENVIEGMKSSGFVHFACHGIQDTKNPLESALVLTGDGKLSLSTISTLNLPHAQFAFLSACQTAVGDDLLAEESVHLSAGMLSAGYQSVIGTTWSISDSDGPIVAEFVYKHLLREQDTAPDAKEAAYALHMAIKHLRESLPRRPFLAWVPFIHIGA